MKEKVLFLRISLRSIRLMENVDYFFNKFFKDKQMEEREAIKE